MLETIIIICAIFGLAFLIKESDGPWGIIAWFRNKLITKGGPFFFKLLECYFCLGFHCGWIVYLLSQNHYTWQFFTLWGLAGGVICLILDRLLSH